MARVKPSSFVCKILGGRPNRGMVRELLQAALQDIMPPIKRVHPLEMGFFHIELQVNANIKEMVDVSSLDLKYGKGILMEWSISFNLTKVNAKLGNPKLISIAFPNIETHLKPLIPTICAKLGTMCSPQETIVELIHEMPKVRILVNKIEIYHLRTMDGSR